MSKTHVIILGAVVLLISATPLARNFASQKISIRAEPELKPVYYTELVNSHVPLNINARSYFVAFVSQSGEVEVLADKAAKQPFPIASITKLMTALVADTQYDPNRLVEISKLSPVTEPDPSFIRVGDIFKLGDLYYPLLVESSNEVAMQLASLDQEPSAFVKAMNDKASQLGMASTRYVNVSGLDDPTGQTNTSSAYDLFRLAREMMSSEQDLLDITRITNYKLNNASGGPHHDLKPTDQLLYDPHLGPLILGGKTGQTDLAKKNLLLIIKEPGSGGYLVAVVLGSDNHFADMGALVDWAKLSYKFNK